MGPQGPQGLINYPQGPRGIKIKFGRDMFQEFNFLVRKCQRFLKFLVFDFWPQN